MTKKLLSALLCAAIILSGYAAFAENEADATQEPAITVIETVSEEVPADEAVEATEETPTEEAVEVAEETPSAPKTISLKYDGVKLALSPAPYMDGDAAMIPVRQIAEYIGFDVSYDEKYNTEVLALGTNYIFFNIDNIYTTAFGKSLNAVRPTVTIDGTVFVSLRTFADILGCELDVEDNGDTLKINMHSSPFVNDYFLSQPVNQWGISSRTDYMVWVSLSQYTVRLYHGKQYGWKLIHECPCAIGAPGTPTVTGSFEYKYRTQWNYNGYYVGPCLVFYRGYALHSVLLRYNNTEYDGRTGVQISHGCIRMKKWDIDLIAGKIPVGTRIYITR